MIDRTEARKKIDALLGDSTAIDVIAARSYEHPNGFRKIVLGADKDGSKLRLHVWPSNFLGTESNVHNHRWSFSTLVLVGGMTSTWHNLTVSKTEGQEFHRFRYRPGSPGGEYELVDDGLAYAKSVSTRSLTPGESYWIRAEQLHSVLVQPGTMTLVDQDAPTREYTDVLRKVELPPQQRVLPLVSSADVAQAATDALEVLDNLD